MSSHLGPRNPTTVSAPGYHTSKHYQHISSTEYERAAFDSWCKSYLPV
jgi:hypothetical protein